MPQIADLERDKIISRFRERTTLGRRTKLYKAELEALIAQFIDLLAKAGTTEHIQQLCADEIALLEEGYPQLTLASDYIPKYRKQIQIAIADKTLPTESNQAQDESDITAHPALIHFKYAAEVYEQLDSRQAKVNRTKLLNLKEVNPHRYLEVLNQLLNSKDKFKARHKAIAIAGLTGRRLGEVLARGTFTLASHPYLLHFEGQQKHERDGYEIITLIPAQQLLEHIQEFRTLPEIQTLMGYDGEDLAVAINKFDVLVNRECNKFLRVREQVVPALENRTNVTIHNLRSIWGAIAVWMFCPPQQHEYAFIQHYLGHVLESSATGHYFRYQLIDANGQLLRDKGTYLGEVDELPLMEISPDDADGEDSPMEFLEDATDSVGGEEQGDAMVSDRPSAISKLRDEMFGYLQQIKEQLREEWAAQMQTLKQQTTTQGIPQSEGQNSDWLTARVAELEAQNQTLRQEKDTLQAQLRDQQQLLQTKQQLEKANQDLIAQLRDAQTKLDQFRTLLLGDTDTDTADTQVQKQAHQDTTETPEQGVNHQPTTEQPTASTPPPKRGRQSGKAQARARAIFNALQQWNIQHPDNTITINPGLLETGFRIHRQAAKKFCIDFATEIEEYNEQIGVNLASTHNRGKDIGGFIAFAESKQTQE